MEPEYFQFLLLMLLSVGKSRPENLMLLANQIGDDLIKSNQGDAPESEQETKCTDVDRVSAFIRLLNDVFWRLFSKRPLSPVVTPVVNPGMWLWGGVSKGGREERERGGGGGGGQTEWEK